MGNIAVKDFEEWFYSEGISPEHMDIMRICWNASLESSCRLFELYEGWDYGVKEELQA